MTARKVDRKRAFDEADLEGKSAPADYVSAALAWGRMERRITPTLAEELGLSRQTMEDWGNPNRRKRGPHLLVAQAIELARQIKSGDEQLKDVLAPLDWLEERFGRLAIDVSKARDGKSPASQVQRIVKLLVDFAQFIDAVDDPKDMDAAARLRARQELQDVIAGAMELLESIPGPMLTLGAVR